MAREFSPEELGIAPVREFSPQELGVSPSAPQQKPEDVGIVSGTGEAFKRGLESFGDIFSGYSLAKSKLFGEDQAAAQKMQQAKIDAAKQQEKPALTFADLERIYAEKGLGSALSQAPKFITEQIAQSAPQMAVPLAVGAGVGAASGPFGVVTGPLAGVATYGAQQLGNLMTRQAQEKATPQELDVGKAVTAAAIQAPIGYFIDRFTVGMGGLGQRGVIEVGKELAARKALGEIGAAGVAKGVTGQAAKGAAEGFIAEAPTEVLEQTLERWQAGLPLTNQDAINEYKEAFAGAGAAGAGIGGGSRGYTAYSTAQQKAEAPKVEEVKTETKAPSQLMLPSPEEIVINQREYDPLKNPLGNFTEAELTPEQIKYIDADRKDNGKPRLQSYSVEDLVDAINHSADTAEAKQGAINTLLTFKSGYTGEQTLTPNDIINMAGMKNVEPNTIGFNDFLRRATGNDDLNTMSQPQLYSAFNALSNVPKSPELQILPEGTNAVRFSEKQYADALKGLEGVYNEYATDSLSRTSVIQEIKDFAGLERAADAEAIYKRALRNNDLEENLRQVKTTEGVKTVPEVSFAGKTEALPSGFDIKEQEFKQGVMPELYEIRNGSVRIDTADTAEAAKAIFEKQAKINQELVKKPLEDIARLEKGIQARERALDIQKAKGFANTLGFQKTAAHMDALNKIDQQSIQVHQNDIKNYNNPLKIVPIGEKPITARKQVFYEEGKPVASFGDKYQAEQYGIMKLDDSILQQIIDSAPTTKGILPKRYAAFAAKEVERRAGKAPKGIEVKRSIYADKVNEDFEKLQKSLLPALKRFGLENVALRVVNSISNGQADGSYVQELIKIAYSAENPMGTLRHESIHALKELGAFTDAEWKVLSNKAKSDWIDQYIRRPKLYKAYQDAYKADNGSLKGFDEYIQEEAIAEAFSDFANTKPPAGLIGNIFYRLNKMFEALGNTFKRLGYTTANDIFAKVERGEAKPTRKAVSEEEKFAKKEGDAPEGIPQNLWDLQKKMRDAESSARDWNYGASKRNLTMASRRLLQEAEKQYGSFEAAQPVLIRMNEESTKREEKLQRKPEEIRKIGENLVGAPPDMKTVKDRTALVKRMTNLLEHPFSMYSKSKDWYERSGDTIAEIAHGDKALMEKIVRLTALYSQANSLGGNITAVIKSMKQLAEGGDTAYAGRFPETTAKVIPQILAAKDFDTDLAGVNDKLMNFYHNLHDGTFKTDTFEDASTIDRWMMRLFGYPHAEDQAEGGASSVSATQYKYAKDLVRKIGEANEKKTGEKLLPRQIQAVLWTYIKNTTEYNNAKEKGKEADFKPSSLDFSDYVNRATANITWESRPSTQVDLLQGIHTAPRKDQDAFNRAVRSIFETDSGENKIFKLLNEGVLYSSQNSIGAYENQIAPNVITRLVLNKDEKGHMTDIADKTAAIIGYVTKQDAVPWYRADPTATGAKGYKVTSNVTPDEAFEDRLFKHLNEAVPGIGFTRVDNSFDFINFRGDDKKPFLMSDAKYINALQEALKTFSPDVDFNIDPFRVESAYIFNDWKEDIDGQGYLKYFSPRQLTDIQPTIDGWRKDYDSIAERFGEEYGWNKPAEGRQRGEKFQLKSPKEIQDGAKFIRTMDEEVRDNTPPADMEGGYYAFNLYEAQNLLPKPSNKLKKVTDENSFDLSNEADYIANVDGEYFGVVKDEDPDDEEATVYRYFRLDQPFTQYEPLTNDVQELFADMRQHLEPTEVKEKLQLKPQEDFEVPETGRKDNLIFLLQDKQIDLKRIIDGLKAQGKEIADKWNAYLQEELFHGRSATRVKFFIDRELQPLLRQMTDANITLEEMDDYLLARHAKEANEYIRSINKDPNANAGMTDKQAEDYLKAIPPVRRQVFDRLAGEVDKMTKETRQLMVDYGLETQETIDAWEKTYKNYVPLFREETEGSPISTGRGYNIRGSTTKQRTGSSKKVVDVLANVALQRERTIARGEKNRVGNALLGLILQNPNSDYWIAVNPDDISQDDLRSELIAMGLDPDVAENLSDKPKEAKLNRDTGEYEYKTNPMWMQQPNVFMTRVNGQDRIMVFNENNERAARMAVIFNNLDQNQKGQALAMMGTAGQYFQDALNVVGKGTRYFAAVNTQYNPAFSIYNFMRDVGGAVLNLQSTPLKGKEYEVISNAFTALKAVYQDLRLERAGQQANSKWAQIFEEFELEGGKTGFRDLFNDSETRARALESELESFKQGGARQKAKAVFDWLSDFNEAVENSIRVSAYKSAKDMGMSPAQAASLAKNLTVNFNRTGAMSKSFTTIYAFFNASIQGSARIAQTLMNSDGTLSSAGKMIVKGGLTVGIMQAVMMAMAGFEEDEPPDFVKDKNFVIPYGDKKYIAIPMPLGFNIIPSFGRRVAEFVMSNDKNVGKTVFDMGNMILDGFNPLGSATFAQTLSPTLTDPIIALAENKDFAGKPIARDDINSLNPTPGYTRAKENASALSKGLAYTVNLLSGGSEFKKGVVSPTPDQIDYLIGQVTGGVGREVLKVEKAIGATVKGEELATFNVPIVGRLIGDVKQKTVETSRFYDNIKSMNEHQQEIDGRLKQGEDIEAYLNKYPEAGLYKYADKVYNKLTKMKQERKKLKERGATDADLKGYDEAILSLMMGFNETVKDSKEI
jgi:hypothetical protein